jgi:hypothetical protein
VEGGLLEQGGRHSHRNQRVGDRRTQQPGGAVFGEDLHLDLGQHRHDPEQRAHTEGKQDRPSPAGQPYGNDHAGCHRQ